MRLEGKTAVIVGAGQTPGATIGNGRATAQLFAREGAKVLAVDCNLASAEETVAQIKDVGGVAQAFEADVTDEAALKAAVNECKSQWGALDILHNNVGTSLGAGDASPMKIEAEIFDQIVAINLRGMILAAKHALPIMREQASGVILNISSVAAIATYPTVGYKTTKAALIAFTEQLASLNAKYGIRANVILPGLMNTPMAIEARAKSHRTPARRNVAGRDAQVPLKGGMGTAWDVAYAALFLASDEAKFITGVSLPVDGGTSVRVG